MCIRLAATELDPSNFQNNSNRSQFLPAFYMLHIKEKI